MDALDCDRKTLKKKPAFKAVVSDGINIVVNIANKALTRLVRGVQTLEG